MTKGNEDKLANRLIPDLIELAENYNLLVDDKIKVMSDFTCLKVENKFKLYVSFSEVDIAPKGGKRAEELISLMKRDHFERYQKLISDWEKRYDEYLKTIKN